MNKKELLELLLHDPVAFVPHFHELLQPSMGLTFDDLRDATRRLYDVNENALLKESNANSGPMGFLNRLSTRRRNSVFNGKVKKGLRLKPNTKLILVEGDSWFQFPLFVTDVIDWLMDRKDYMIYSLAYGGDWLTNIVYEGQYIEELSIVKPDVFLISGCGNDMVGSNRLAIMVDKDKGIGKTKAPEHFEKACFHVDPEFTIGRKYITKEFYAFVLVMKAQYWKIFEGIATSGKFSKMQIITQGYANAIPSYSKAFSWRYPQKILMNYFLDTGKWLKRPLMIKGIPDTVDNVKDIHRMIVKTMIHELNEMFIQLAHHFPNVYHIDSRNLITNKDQWFDELHLNSSEFKKVADIFQECIDGFQPMIPATTKVFQPNQRDLAK